MKRLLALTALAILLVAQSDVCCAQWVQCNGPGWGSVLTLATLGPYVFAGTSGDGLLRSTDAGKSWDHVPIGKFDAGVVGIVVSGPNVFAASDSLYSSSDSGWTWQSQPLSKVAEPGPAGPMAILGRYVVLTAPDGVFRTSDRGRTWDDIGKSFNGSECVLVKGSDLYVGRYSSGLYVSTDSGDTWSTIEGVDSIMNGASIQSLAFAGNDLFAGAYNDEGFFRSTDNGITWDSADIGLRTKDSSSRYEGVFVSFSTLFQDSDRLFGCTSEGLFRSRDSGFTWTLISPLIINAFARSGSNLLAGTSTGILVSTDDGSTWTPSDQGMNGGTIAATGSSRDHIFISIEGIGLYRSDDSGGSWVKLTDSAWGGAVVGFVTIDTSIFAFSYPGLHRSTDDGDTWDSLPEPGWPAVAIGSSLFANGYDSSYLTTDYGAHWSSHGQTFPATCILAVGGMIYQGNASGDCSVVGVSSDTGLTWTYLKLNKCTDVHSLAYDSNYIYCGTAKGAANAGLGVLRRSMQDTAWSVMDTGLPGSSRARDGVPTIVGSLGNIFLGTNDFGVFSSSNSGANWSDANLGLSTGRIMQLIVCPPYIFAGTQGAGIWRRPLSDFGISSVAQTPPSPPQIQSYPNPFTQSTTITFSSQDEGYADVTVVNLLGVQVARIFSGELSAGEHTFSWDAGGFAPGMYECIVRNNGVMQRVSMLYTQ